MPAPPQSEAHATRVALSAFFLSGLLMCLPGAILPAWGYHIRDEFLPAGAFFLATAAGLMLSIAIAPTLRRFRQPSLVIAVGGGLGAAAFLALAFTGPPVGSDFATVDQSQLAKTVSAMRKTTSLVVVLGPNPEYSDRLSKLLALGVWREASFIANQERNYPLRRLGTSDDVARGIRYLLSDEAAWMTGQILSMDGGATAT